MIEDNKNREEVDKATNKMHGAHKALDKCAGCAQEKSARVWVAHKAIDYGVAPERRFGEEACTKKAVDLVNRVIFSFTCAPLDHSMSLEKTHILQFLYC